MKLILTILLIPLSLICLCQNRTHIGTDYQGLDTVKCLIQYSDTLTPSRTILFARAYEVRKKYCCTSGYDGFYAVPIYEHFAYLDENRKTFKSSIIIWQKISE